MGKHIGANRVKSRSLMEHKDKLIAIAEEMVNSSEKGDRLWAFETLAPYVFRKQPLAIQASGNVLHTLDIKKLSVTELVKIRDNPESLLQAGAHDAEVLDA